MTSSEIRALTHAALLVLGLGLIRVAVEGVRSPVTTTGASVPDSSGLVELLEKSRASRDEVRRRTTPLTDGERMDPNTASEEDLDRLPGVGPAVAGRIIQRRLERPFRVVDDLLSVPGVGPAMMVRIAPYLELPARPVRGGSAGPFHSPSDAAEGPGPREPVRLDLNRASRQDLERLPGVGPVMAERILTLRKDRGGFRSLEELQSVRGIGSATLERLRPVLVIER